MVKVPESKPVNLKNRIRFITATSLFDGHDAAIHIMRRILQSQGAEVIHLGHNRSVEEIVNAAIQEDVHGIAISSYQGGHMEYFTYMLELLKKGSADHIKVYGGGGGVITPDEISELHKRGVSRIFSPEDGQKMGLVGMIQYMLKECDSELESLKKVNKKITVQQLSRLISQAENDSLNEKLLNPDSSIPVLGITGPGGAGKSSLVDELLLRTIQNFPNKKIAVLSVDPTRRRTGGALLGDRIRMNCASHSNVFMRSMATRRANLATSSAVNKSLDLMKSGGFDLIILETAGIGQSDSEVCDLADLSIYVMTPEFGAPTQLEKIDMLDYADFVVLNKFDRNGALDALRDVQKTYRRNRNLFDSKLEDLPVYGTCAHHFNDPGTNRFFNALAVGLDELQKGKWKFEKLPEGDPLQSSLIPVNRRYYLSDIVNTVRNYHRKGEAVSEDLSKAQSLYESLSELSLELPKIGLLIKAKKGMDETAKLLIDRYNGIISSSDNEVIKSLQEFSKVKQNYETEINSYSVRGKEIKAENYSKSLSGLDIPKISLPETSDWGDIYKFIRKENIPGEFPYSAGVFPYKRQGEDPTRMFAGEGHAEQTNRRFHFVSKGQAAARLSTAFDSVTLYGNDPDKRPDIYGKVGNSGVSICSLDDAKRLYSGFDLISPSTSVSMTINGPAPTILAFFMNAAIDAECERKLIRENRWEEVQKKLKSWFKEKGITQPEYRAELPDSNGGDGLGFLGVPASEILEKDEYNAVKKDVLQKVRGTVQADILKEDQAQNTCIFSTEFSMKLMGDVQEYFIQNNVRNFYSVSVSGYHIAEAGATPVTQLAFTLANGFTLLEYYLSRGMKIDDFAHNLSFFFSNGMDPEYSVIGRVARRIWAIAIKELYDGNERSQKLKYHIQTSGRSLHSQEVAFNDIRTTLQALYAIMDNCNSLHTNAYDEAITTPTEESVRRAIAIQMIINHECGLTVNENPIQGSYFLTKLTDMVEEAVLNEFLALDSRGGVLGAMETMYQRGKIQDESMEYEHKKHSGEHKIVGVNFWLDPNDSERERPELELRRSSDECKNAQISQVEWRHKAFKKEIASSLKKLKETARNNGNVFEELMEASKWCTLGQITEALFEVGGAYRRNM